MSKKLDEFEKEAIKLVRNHNKASSKLRDKMQKQIEDMAGEENVRPS